MMFLEIKIRPMFKLATRDLVTDTSITVLPNWVIEFWK